MGVVIASELLRQIVSAAERSPEAEVCGLLLGLPRHAGLVPASTSPQAPRREGMRPGGCRDEPGMTKIGAVRACTNVAADPARRFEIDPAMLLAAHRAARAGGPAVIGHHHSHPSGDPMPSLSDAADAAPDGAIWLITARGEVRAFRAVAAGSIHGRFVPLALHVAG